MSKLNVSKTTTLSLISASLWNAFLIYLGITFGKNVDVIDGYLNTYSNIILIITGVVILFFVIKNFIIKRKTKN